MAENEMNTSGEEQKNFWERVKENGEKGKENIKNVIEKAKDNGRSFAESVRENGLGSMLATGAVGIGETLKQWTSRLLTNIKSGLKHIIKQIADNKEVARKLGVLQEELDNLEDIVQNNNEISEERMAAMVECLSRLNDRIADFSADNIDKFVEDIQKNLEEAYDTLGETFVLRAEQIEEALEKILPKEFQDQYKVFIVPEKGTGELKAILSTGSDSHESTFSIERNGNFCSFRAMSDEEVENLEWTKSQKAKGSTLVAKAKFAYETCCNNSRNEAQMRIDDLRSLIEVLNTAKGNTIEQDGYKFQYDKEQSSFVCELEDGSKMILSATANSMTGYYQEKAGDTPTAVFVINRTENENGEIENLCEMNVPLNLTDKVNDFLSVPEINTILRVYNGENIPENIEQSNNGRFSKTDTSGAKRVSELYNTLNENPNLTARYLEKAGGNIAVTVKVKGGKDQYMLTFTPDGKHTGYDYIDSKGNSTIISRSGGVVDAVTAESENFQTIHEAVTEAMKEVNQKIEELQNTPASEISEEDKALIHAEKFEAADIRHRNGVFLLTEASRRRGFDSYYTEEKLREELGDKKFEKLLEDAKQVICQFESLMTSPDGETEGYYKELRGMPESEQKELAQSAGMVIGKGRLAYGVHRTMLADEKIRAIVNVACQQVFKDNPPHQILNVNSFATAYMEAVHDAFDGKKPAEIGSRIMQEIIAEQNYQYQRDNGVHYIDTHFVDSIDEKILPNQEKEENAVMQLPLSQERIAVFNELIQGISEGRLSSSADYSELEEAMLTEMENKGMIYGYERDYQFLSETTPEQLNRFINDFILEHQNEEMHERVDITITTEQLITKMALERSYHEMINALVEGRPVENAALYNAVNNFAAKVTGSYGVSAPSKEQLLNLANQFATEYVRSEIGVNALSTNTRSTFENTMGENRFNETPEAVPVEFQPIYAKVMLENYLVNPDIETGEMEIRMISAGYGDYPFDNNLFRSVQKFAEENNIHYHNGTPVIEVNGNKFDLNSQSIRNNVLTHFIQEQFGEEAVEKANLDTKTVQPEYFAPPVPDFAEPDIPEAPYIPEEPYFPDEPYIPEEYRTPETPDRSQVDYEDM